MRTSAAAVVFILLGLLITTSAMAVDVFPLEQLEPGLRGHGLTVIRGFNVETFFVEILDVIPQSPPIPPLVMVRVSGDVIERSGGIAAGMSGSPVYIDDKLLGAIGYGYALTDHRIGLVTPAGPMLEMMELLPETHLPLDPIHLPRGFSPLQTPLMLGGFGQRARLLMAERWPQENVQIMTGTAGFSMMENPPSLQPGSAFAVQLLRGDFQAASFGTVTHVAGHKFVGFGHSFMHRGEVEYFVTPASVHYTMPNLEFPFKIASTGPTVGSLLQDRGVGVAGVLDREPPFLPVNIRITDEDKQITREFSVDAVKDPSIVETLVISSAYQAVDATLDRVGSGTGHVRLEFQGENLTNRVIRDNMYYSDSDIAVWSLVDLAEGLNLFIHNALQEVILTEVQIEIAVEKQRRTAAIEKATPRVFQVKPGESIEVEVQIRPYRAAVETRILRMEVPPDTLPGMMTVTVRAGGSDYFIGKPPVHTTFQDVEDGDEPMRQAPSGAESLEKLIEQYVNRERGNEIVLEFYPFLDTFPVAEEPDDYEDQFPPGVLPDSDTPMQNDDIEAFDEFYGYGASWDWDSNAHEPIKVRLDTGFVMEGMASFDLEILP